MKLSALSMAARKRGVSLIEGVLYLVIALAVIVGGIVFFQQAQLSNNVTDTSRAAVGISSQTRGLYQNQRSFGAVDITSALVNSGSVPANFLDASNNISHPFGAGTVQVKGNMDGFAILFEDLTQEACMRLATVGEGGDGPLGTGIEGIVRGTDLTSIAASEWDGDLSDIATTGATWDARPVTAADVAASCADDIDILVSYER